MQNSVSNFVALGLGCCLRESLKELYPTDRREAMLLAVMLVPKHLIDRQGVIRLIARNCRHALVRARPFVVTGVILHHAIAGFLLGKTEPPMLQEREQLS